MSSSSAGRSVAMMAFAVLVACRGAPGPAPTTTPAAHPTTTATTTTTPTTTTTTTVAARPPPPAPLVDIQEIEPSIVVVLNTVAGDNVTGRPLPGYEANRAFLLPEAAQALAAVQRALAAQGLGLKVYDGYRPLRATRALVEWAESHGRGDLVGPYIASLSYHNSGQAVDLTLIDRASGSELDMGAPYETFTSDAHTANATGAAARNRSTLVTAMEAAGFDNYEGEWWHFNYFVAGAVVLDEPVR